MQSRNFTKSKMNLDADKRLLSPGEYREAYNFEVDSENQDGGVGKNSMGNLKLYDINFGANAKCIGGVVNENASKIYVFVRSDTISAIIEWDENNETATKVLWDSRAGTANVLAFPSNYLISSAQILIDTDNDRTFLLWGDGNELRCVSVERAKGYGDNGFTEDQIVLIKAPPVKPPTIALSSSTSLENYIEEEFLEFAYRWKYLDNFYSPISPFSPIAFEPMDLNYDYATGTNESMVNKYNKVDVTFNVGGSEVIGVDLLFKRSGETIIYVVESFDKSVKGWMDDEDITLSFLNDKRYRQLPSDEIGRPFDRIPWEVNAITVIDNRLVLGNYTEDFNLIDDNANDIELQLSLDYSATAIADSSPVQSVKSIRDYEAVIVYYDKYGRGTIGLGSENNSTSIKNIDCNKENQLTLTIQNKPPSFATHYRIFIRQPKVDYYTIAPVVFFSDGAFVWIQLLGDDQDKFNKGDFLYVKSDTNGILASEQQTEVLELKEQPQNFLEPDTETQKIQEAGTYFKIKPTNFALNLNNASLHNFISKGFASKNDTNDITGNINYIEDAIYYGIDGLNDASSGGTYTGTTDIRYIIEITTAAATDLFRWSDDDGATWTTGVSCAITAVSLSNGVEVTFGAITGHNTDDEWIISAKADDVIAAGNANNKAWVPYKGKPASTEEMAPGAKITIKYLEKRDTTEMVEYSTTFIATQAYANLEEWFFGDNVISQLIYPSSLDSVVFRRGTGLKDPVESIDIGVGEDMFMLFLSSVAWQDAERIRVDASIEIVELANNIILETKPIEDPSEIYYEIGKTYLTTGGFHVGDTGAGDTTQTAVVPATLNLPFFNCFAWSNGFEAYRIKDKLNQRSFNLKTRATSTYPNYRANKRKASLIYGGRYEQETNYNSLNEFNPSQKIFVDMDDKYGSIQYLLARENKIMVFQQDKITPVGYFTRLVYDQAGNPSLVKSDDVLAILEPYAWEGGISNDPATIARDGNRIYFLDERRGQVCRFSNDGVTPISEYGLSDFFRTDFRANPDARRIGEFDPYHDRYVIHSEDLTLAYPLMIYCGGQIFKLNNSTEHTYTFTFGQYDTDLTLAWDISLGNIDVVADWDGNITQQLAATGTGNIVVNRTDFDVDTVSVTITPNTASSYKLTHTCASNGVNKVKVIVINDASDYDGMGASMVHRYNINAGGSVFEESNIFDQSGTTLFKTLTGLEDVDPIPESTDTINLEAYSALIADHLFESQYGNRIGYLVSANDYGVSDIATILTGATFPTITQTDASGARTNEITFVFTKGASSDILYLIFDYRNLSVIANADSGIALFWGESQDINVLANDSFEPPGTVTIETAPTHGTAVVLPNNTIRYTHDGGSDASDSFTYRLTNEYGTDTATVSITLTEDTGTGEGGGSGSNPGLAWDISSSGRSTSALACALSTSQTVYHDGTLAYPQVDDNLYNESGKTTAFNGSNNWYKDEINRAIQISPTGRVLATNICY